MRVVVTGTSGAGKTTLSRRIAAEYGIPRIELDALNWGAGWFDRSKRDQAGFLADVAAAVAGDAWVMDGNYGIVREIAWARATHVVWLDYSRLLIMRRVIWRSLSRAVLRTELWAGNRERFGHLLEPDHPIRWAWSTHARRRREMAARIDEPGYAHLRVARLRTPREAAALFAPDGFFAV